MSVIRVDNFGPSAGGTTYSARGIAKAWVNFNGTGTIAARDSENVSSLTDNATGDYTVNLSNGMSDGNYFAGGAISLSGGGVTTALVHIASSQSANVAPTASALRLSVFKRSDATAIDSDYSMLSIHGDLA